MLRKLSNLLSYIYFLIFCFFHRKGIHLNGRVVVKGIPIIELVKGAIIDIGEMVTLNSSNHKYHINMFAPVKLIADNTEAKIIIGSNTRIHGTCIHAKKYISIGANCLIAANTNIMDCDGHNMSFENVKNRLDTEGNTKKIIIKDNVWIGTSCIILPGSIIGEGSVIGAGSVVKGEIPPYCLAVGSPAKVVKIYDHPQSQ